MKSQGWRSTDNVVYLLNYHLVWSTKNPKHILIPPIDISLSNMIMKLCDDNHLEIIGLEVMPDHVHLFLFAKPIDSPSNRMKTIRRVTAYGLFREFPSIKKKLWGGHLWNPSYYEEQPEKYPRKQSNDILRTKKQNDNNHPGF